MLCVASLYLENWEGAQESCLPRKSMTDGFDNNCNINILARKWWWFSSGDCNWLRRPSKSITAFTHLRLILGHTVEGFQAILILKLSLYTKSFKHHYEKVTVAVTRVLFRWKETMTNKKLHHMCLISPKQKSQPAIS